MNLKKQIQKFPESARIMHVILEYYLRKKAKNIAIRWSDYLF